MAYFDTKKDSLEEAIKAAVSGQIDETNKNNKSDDGEGMDAVQPKAVKKKFADRKDKDIDNDGDTDASDKYLHKRRKAVSKAIKSEDLAKDDEKSVGKVIKGLKKAVKIHQGQVDSLDKDIKDSFEYELDEATAYLDLDNRDPKLLKDIAKFGLKVKLDDEDGPSSKYSGYSSYKITGPKAKIIAANKKLKLTQDLNIDGKFVESFEYGTPEATKNSLMMTPGQSSQEWDEQVGLMHKKQNTMREAIAKMWGVEEGHNPFKKEEKNPKKESKTMTGKPVTKVSVNSDEKKD